MLTKNEKKLSKRFLSQEFQTNDLLSLVETITNRMVTVQSKSEAIRAIISHSDSVHELLHRRKVKRENIFNFLASEKVHVLAASDKPTLIRQFLSHCGTQAPVFEEAVEVAREPYRIPSASISVSCTVIQQNIHVSGNSSTQVPSKPITQELAEQFTKWFYALLNSIAHGTIPNPSEWGPQHFWEDSRLRLNIITTERRTDVFEGSEVVADRLKCLVSDEGLMFNPNNGPGGTSGVNDSHGLVIVRACGTLHQHNKCLGLFEQQFGLIRAPLEQNTWKIKFTDINLKQCAVENMPMLDGPPNRMLANT